MPDASEVTLLTQEDLRTELRSFFREIVEKDILKLHLQLQRGIHFDLVEMFGELRHALALDNCSKPSKSMPHIDFHSSAPTDDRMTEDSVQMLSEAPVRKAPRRPHQEEEVLQALPGTPSAKPVTLAKINLAQPTATDHEIDFMETSTRTARTEAPSEGSDSEIQDGRGTDETDGSRRMSWGRWREFENQESPRTELSFLPLLPQAVAPDRSPAAETPRGEGRSDARKRTRSTTNASSEVDGMKISPTLEKSIDLTTIEPDSPTTNPPLVPLDSLQAKALAASQAFEKKLSGEGRTTDSTEESAESADDTRRPSFITMECSSPITSECGSPSHERRQRRINSKISQSSIGSRSSSRSGTLQRLAPAVSRRRSSGSMEKLALLAQANEQSAQRRVLEVVHKPVFDYVVAGLILANGILVGLHTDYIARAGLEKEPVFFRVAEVTFCVFFTIELALRLFAYRGNFFTMSQRGWNIFDLVIVSLQLLEITVSLVAQGFGFNFNTLRMLRLLRVVLLARTLRLIPELRTIFSSIACSLKPLLWTGFLLCLTAYVVGVSVTQLVHMKRLTLTEKGESMPSDIDTYWGDVPVAIFTLIQSITGGVDWDNVCRPLMETVGVEVGILFMSFILFSNLALLNVITGVFIDAVMENGKRNKALSTKQHVQALFATLDVNDDGEIQWSDFESRLDRKEMKDFFKIVDVDIANAKNLFELIDSDGSGTIDATEFMDGCLRIWSPAKDLDLRMLSRDLCRVDRKLEVLGTMHNLNLSTQSAELSPISKLSGELVPSLLEAVAGS